MKKILLGIIFFIFIFALTVVPAFAAKPKACVTIQDGTLKDSEGALLTTGYDKWGYNYQAHMFNGNFCDALHNNDPSCPYKEWNYELKWNDAWLSNEDCDGDGLLDMHRGYPTYRGSGAWITLHLRDAVYNEEGCTASYSVKIVAVPADATLIDGVWYAADGKEIGPIMPGISEEFAQIQYVSKDPCAGEHGLSDVVPVGPGTVGPGLGKY